MTITGFRGKHSFLSNFYTEEFMLKGRVMKTAEHAFQACKTLDKAQQMAVLNAETPKLARAMGTKVSLRAGWNDMRLRVMYKVLLAKFAPGTYLALRLVATGEKVLIEENSRGVCDGKGQNNLGVLLMAVRGSLKAQGGKMK